MGNFRVLAGAAVAAAVLTGAGRPAAADAWDSKAFLLSDAPAPATRQAQPAYSGGRGLVTLEGQTGMFLFPTSGTLNQGQFTAQYCVLFPDYSTDVVAHGLMLDYGITDWLDAGAFGLVVDTEDTDPLVGGPQVRVRVLKDEGWVPEVSIGGIYLDGDEDDDVIARADVWIAASKGITIDPDGFLHSIRLHGGYLHRFLNEAPGSPDEQDFIYGGLEFYLPYSISLIGELSSNDLNNDGDDRPGYAIGIQWKPTTVLGITAAHLRSPGDEDPAFFFGVGLTFKF